MLSADSDSNVPAEDPPANPADLTVQCLDDQKDEWFDHRKHIDASMDPYFGSLDAAIDHILAAHADDGVRSDVKVEDLDKWVFGSNGFACIARREPMSKIFYLRHTAFGHLCERSKAPSKYLRSIPSRYSIPALNWGITNRSEGPALIRLADDDEVRAILSSRYAAFDDCVVLPQLRVSLGASNLLDSVVARVVATGQTTLMRIGIHGDAIAIPGTDEIAEVALDLTNGEVGNRAVALSPSVYLRKRGVATRRTGRGADAGVRLRHLGSSDKIAEEFREAIPEALAASRKLRAQIATAVDRAISDIVSEAEKLQALGLTLAEARDVLRQLARTAGVDLPHDTAEWEEPLDTLKSVRAFDVFVAIATLGEERGTNRRLDLEEAAARYLARVTK